MLFSSRQLKTQYFTDQTYPDPHKDGFSSTIQLNRDRGWRVTLANPLSIKCLCRIVFGKILVGSVGSHRSLRSHGSHGSHRCIMGLPVRPHFIFQINWEKMRIKGRVRIQLCSSGFRIRYVPDPDLPGLPGYWLSLQSYTGHNLQKLDRSE